MKKSPGKTVRRKAGSDEHPLEFDRGWHELESRHDRLKTDWGSLAALINGGPRKAY